jgi:hypothetical protein
LIQGELLNPPVRFPVVVFRILASMFAIRADQAATLSAVLEADGNRGFTAISPFEFLAGPLNLVERIFLKADEINEGRVFGIGRQIWLHGYGRRVTVGGEILPDHYTALRFCGFDDLLLLAYSSTSRVAVPGKALTLTGVLNPVSLKLEPFTLTGRS